MTDATELDDAVRTLKDVEKFERWAKTIRQAEELADGVSVTSVEHARRIIYKAERLNKRLHDLSDRVCGACEKVHVNSRQLVYNDLLIFVVCRSCYMLWLNDQQVFDWLQDDEAECKEIIRAEIQAEIDKRNSSKKWQPVDCPMCGRTITKSSYWRKSAGVCRRCKYKLDQLTKDDE